MKAVKILFCCHLAALTFGLAGLLIALPHPELWNKTPYGMHVFTFGMHYAGSLHILLGTATMLLFGLLFVGVRKTLIFFAVSTLIPLGMELMGTSTGFPFGPYSYTDFLDQKILGLVPYAIPLSWFYMGFTSFLLANLLIAHTRWSHKTLWCLLIGVYFLTVWDLSLDPAMANDRLPVHFWIWYKSGPYFGMPISNLVGWSMTGLLYMSVSRLFWRENLAVQRIVTWLPFGMYAANTCFAIILNLSTGLFLPALIGFILGLLPATLVLLRHNIEGPEGPEQEKRQKVVRAMSHWTVRKTGQALLKQNTTLSIEGDEHIPPTGPTLIVAHHYHHLYDGCALLRGVPQQLHILVASDWINKHWQRRLMEFACGLVEWPVVLRTERVKMGHSAYAPHEVRGFLRRASSLAVQLLRQGKTLVIFPEAYPVIDPMPMPIRNPEGFLPFRPGFARLVEMAENDQRTRVAIIPVGFSYTQNQRWQIILRFGQALFRRDFHNQQHLIQAVEQRVRELSISAPYQASRDGPHIYGRDKH